MFSQEPDEFRFTAGEIRELLSFFQSGELPVNSTSDSYTNRSVYSVEERKRRRTESNRESARRSRQRKKRHLENLEEDLNRMRVKNRELKDRLGLVQHHCRFVERETDRLWAEAMDLQTRLFGLCQILVNMHFQ